MDEDKKETLDKLENFLYSALANAQTANLPLSEIHHGLRALEIIQNLNK